MITSISKNKVFNGWHKQYSHDSKTLNCSMRFAIFLPPSANEANPVPTLYWLSGLTCTDENFMQKSGAFRLAAELGIAIVAPDTSPRGETVPDDENYDLGQGAGFYLNATQEPWVNNFQMYDYIAKELPELIEAYFPVSTVKSISGHSMGGHGALTIGIDNQQGYQSISAFSPISNPMSCPWGQRAFQAYLGGDKEAWKQYDASELLKAKKAERPILVDVGDADDFLTEQLKPETLVAAAELSDTNIAVRHQPGYDHSYYFVSSFIDDHLRFHAKYLGGRP